MMRSSTLHAFVLSAALSFASRAAAESGGELALFDLDAQLQRETSVASARPKSIRETPGVVTVLGREALRATGARDLQELLLLVPGFQLGVDVLGSVDVGFRGHWGHEGKVLLLVDGFEMNDLLYGTNALGNRYLLDQVESVEIIRGPGSAVYGGFAELAVVNVTTRSARELAGGALTATWGQGRGGYARRDATAAAGAVWDEASLSVIATLGQGSLGEGRYVDYSGAAYEMRGSSQADPGQIEASAAWKSLQLRFLYDDYRGSTRDGFGDALAAAVPVRYRSTFADAHYEWKVADHVTVTPRFTWKRQTPWQMNEVEPGLLFYDKGAERFQGRVTATADLGDVTILAGAEAYADRAWMNQPAVPLQANFDGKDRVAFTNVAAYGEVEWDSPIVNLLVGGRAERHSEFGGSLVPRVALTKLFAPFNAKLLWSGAFRAPAIEDLSTNPAVKPERTYVLEAELGCQLGDGAFASVNAFDMSIDGPIVYTFDPTVIGSGDVYRNYKRTGTRGVEAELRLGGPRASATVGYSFYSAAGQNQVELYDVPGHPSALLGFATHKATFVGRVALWRDLALSTSVLVLGERYAVRALASDGTAVYGSLAAGVFANVFASYRGLFARGVDLTLGVRDLLGTGLAIPQPYANAHAPLPGPGREVFAQLAWNGRE